MLGAGWLIWKTDGTTQAFARRVAHSALILTASMMLLVSAWSAWSVPEVAQRWFAWPNIAFLAPVPVVTAAVLLTLWRNIWRWRELETFLLTIIVFLLGFAGLVISLWPYVVPRHVTIWEGASDPQTLAFIGVGVAIVMPIVLAYQAHAYWVFRGKTRRLEGYGDASPGLREAE
jgi:cytochrome d ubiquinol oxidase subunit II